MTFNKRLGYYVCDGQEFESKIVAGLHSNKVNKPVEWIFNDSVFGHFNWTVEPEESLDALYDRRARQLRERYDYIIISYSGGADSHNLLMSFVRQKLHVDEIIVNHTEKAGSKFINLSNADTSASNCGAEYRLQAVPRLQELAPHIPNTKITVLDLSDYVFHGFETVKDASWVLTKKEGLNPAGVSRFNYIYYNDVRKNFDKNLKIGLILGIDKPKSTIKDGNLYIRFVDRIANIVTVAEHIKDYTNTTVEFFYWSPECVPMLIKQGHIIKKWLQANPHMIEHWESTNVNFAKIRLVHERVLRSVVYTTWDDTWFQADKAVKDWYTEFDQWFIEGYQDTDAFRVWQEGIEYVKNHTGSLHNVVNGEADGLRSFARYYKIGPIQPK